LLEHDGNARRSARAAHGKNGGAAMSPRLTAASFSVTGRKTSTSRMNDLPALRKKLLRALSKI
jgi:hypothetical protein